MKNIFFSRVFINERMGGGGDGGDKKEFYCKKL